MVFGCGSRIMTPGSGDFSAASLAVDARPPHLDAPDAPAQPLLGRLEVVAQLQVEPELRRGPEVAREAQRRVRRDAAQAAHDLVDPPRRHLGVDREAVLRDAEAVEEIALQYFTGMWRALRHDYARCPILTLRVNTLLCIERVARPSKVRMASAIRPRAEARRIGTR